MHNDYRDDLTADDLLKVFVLALKAATAAFVILTALLLQFGDQVISIPINPRTGLPLDRFSDLKD